jgi:hypothetical protein
VAEQEPYCDTCEGAHDDHAAHLAARAAAIAAWSESARSLEAELGRSRAHLTGMAASGLLPRDGSDDRAGERYREIGQLIARLRLVTDAAAWRAQQEAAAARAEAAAEVAECGYCTTRITLLGGHWTAGDGTAACTDTSAPYVPHKPREAGQ